MPLLSVKMTKFIEEHGDIAEADKEFIRGLIDAVGSTDWFVLATRWSSEPVINASIAGGIVYTYTYDQTTLYRYVPEPYDSNLDSFYSGFDGTTLSGLVSTRALSL